MAKKKTTNQPTVSIVTINQLKRSNTVKLTKEYINNQQYTNIVEWVIVEGSKNLEDSLTNEENIKFNIK